MKPGLSRAIPYGLLGFMGGAMLVVLIRSLQSMDPVWDPQIGFIMAAFSSAATFVVGMGGFNPTMNQHPHEPELDEYGLMVVDAHEEEHHEETVEETPPAILASTLWQITTFTLVLFVVLMGFASIPGGFFLRTTSDPAASPIGIGYSTVNLFGTEIIMSQLTAFIIFVAFTLISLIGIGGLIALVFFNLSGGVQTVRANSNRPIETVPEKRRTTATARFGSLAVFMMLSVVLYLLFYYVLIGLVVANPQTVRVLLSVVNALLVAAIIVYPVLVLRNLGKAAGWGAKMLRGLPAFLFQR